MPYLHVPIGSGVAVVVAAQERIAFEVAAVKPNNAGPAAGESLNAQGGTIVVTNMTLRGSLDSEERWLLGS